MKKSLFILLLTLLGSIVPLVSASALPVSPTTVCLSVYLNVNTSSSTDQPVEIEVVDLGNGSAIVYDQTFTIPAHGNFTIQQVISVPGVGPFSPDFGVLGTGISGAFGVSPALCPSVSGGGPGHIDDGRINAFDLGAPLAAYCTPGGGIAVWDIDDSGHGTLGFIATPAAITKALSDAQASGQTVLVGEGLGDRLYALSTHQLTLVGPDLKEPGKTYEFLFAADRCG